MNTFIKRTASVAAAAAVSALSMVPALAVCAAEPGDKLTVGDYVYAYNSDDGLSLVNYNGTDTTVVVPDEVNGIPVNSVCGACASDEEDNRDGWGTMNNSIEKLVLGKNVQEICCSFDASGEDYYGWSDTAIHELRNLKTIDVSPENETFSSENGVLFDKNKEKLINFPCGREGVYTVPDGVTEIANDAFQYSKITNVRLPEGLKRIGCNSFYKAENIKELRIPASVENIGMNCNGGKAFYGSGLEKVVIGDGMKSMDTSDSVFSYAPFQGSELKEIYVPASFEGQGLIGFSSLSVDDEFEDMSEYKVTMYGFEGSPAQEIYSDNQYVDFVVIDSYDEADNMDANIDWSKEETFEPYDFTAANTTTQDEEENDGSAAEETTTGNNDAATTSTGTNDHNVPNTGSMWVAAIPLAAIVAMIPLIYVGIRKKSK